MVEKSQKLGELLLEKEWIQRSELSQALEDQRLDQRKLGEILSAKGILEEQKLTEALAELFQMPFVRLSETKIDQSVFSVLSNDLLQTYQVFPLEVKDNNVLLLATNDPLNVSALQDIQYKTGYSVEPVMASSAEIKKFLEEYADSLHTVSAIKTDKSSDKEGGYVMELVDSIIRSAIREKASDIHLEPMKKQLRVRFRIDGVLYEKAPVNSDLARNVIARLKIMAGMDVTENRKPQDGRIGFTHNNLGYDLRLSSLVNVHGEDMVLRILSKEFHGQSFEALGMADEDIVTINKLIAQPHGLILVTGPTGAGKTTSLYSMLEVLNQSTKNIISVEDPVEYEIEGINQTAINKFTDYTFATSMRYILRHDPDVIMLGEIRDVETAEAAIRAALTGHLVLSTMHTNTAAGAITRLLEMDIEPFLIASAVKGVVAQRLVRKVCPSCHKEYMPFPEIKHKIEKSLAGKQVDKLVKAVGCSACLQTGFNGRCGVFEVLTVDEKMKEMMLAQKSEREIHERAIEQGMKSLTVDGMHKVNNKKTTIEEIVRITTSV